MTQPSFVPIAEADQVRPALRLQVPGSWTADRPAEGRPAARPTGRGFGSPGPDQGYALKLVRRLRPELHLVAGEAVEDVEDGLALLAARRAALFGRAPCIHDLRLAAALWGYTDPDAPGELVAARRHTFSGVSHSYVVQRALVDSVPEETLRLTPAQVEGRASSEWRQLTNG